MGELIKDAIASVYIKENVDSVTRCYGERAKEGIQLYSCGGNNPGVPIWPRKTRSNAAGLA